MTSQYDDLEKLADLKHKGIITEEEFNIKKNEILNSISNTINKESSSFNSTKQNNSSVSITDFQEQNKSGKISVTDSIKPEKSIKKSKITLPVRILIYILFILIAMIVLTIIFGEMGSKTVVNPQATQEPKTVINPQATQRSIWYQSDSSGAQSISVQQIFEDTTNWGGEDRFQIITGYVKKLSISKDALGNGNLVTRIAIGYNDKSIDMILDDPIDPSLYKNGDQISIQGWFNLVGTIGVGRGKVYNGPVSVVPWHYTQRPKVPSVITIDDYFSKNMRLGNAPITVIGQVSQKVVNSDELVIDLGSHTGRIIGRISGHNINDKVRQQYASIQIGDRVAFKGSFFQEMDNISWFNIHELILNPQY